MMASGKFLYSLGITAFLVSCGGTMTGRPEDPMDPQNPGESAKPETPDPSTIPPGGAPTIEKLFVQLTIGINDADADVIASLLPPPDLFKDVIMCPEGAELAGIAETVKKQLETVMAAVASQGISIEFDQLVVIDEKTKHFAPGDVISAGCTAGMDLTMSYVAFRMFVTAKGQIKDDEDEFIVLRVGTDGPWYIIGPG